MIDDVCWEMLVDEWLVSVRTSDRSVAQGRLVMVDGDRIAPHLGADLGKGRWRAGEFASATLHAHLLRVEDGVPPAVFDWTLAGQLGECLAEGARFAAACPNVEFGEFDLSGPPVRPRDSGRHVQACVEAYSDALACGATVVIFPELAGYDDVTDALRRHAPPQRPTLVVAGSGHQLEGGELCNRSLLWVARPERNSPVTAILKRVPYEGALGREPLKRVASELRVFIDGPVRMVVGICRDLLDGDVVAALVSLGVNVVVTVAASKKTTPFRTNLGLVAVDTPGIGIAANGPARYGDALVDTAIVAMGVNDGDPVMVGRCVAPGHVCVVIGSDENGPRIVHR